MTTCISYESYSDPDASWWVPQIIVNSKLSEAVFETLKNMKKSENHNWEKSN